jgi:hypothetical protein
MAQTEASEQRDNTPNQVISPPTDQKTFLRSPDENSYQ